ncbi:MAG: AI-2E family transporter [Peptostreptococcus sp.]|uniref:AI-2E family transporter n=1 Tax=Peptostreptococcus sp. TaxID=1262 RepID=UPI002FC8A36E
MENRFKYKNLCTIFIMFGVVLAISLNAKEFLGGASNFLSVFKPVFLGCVIAFILNIIVSLWEKIYFPNSKNKFILKSRRAVCILLSFLSIILIIYLVFMLVIPQLIKSMSVFTNKFPELYDDLRRKTIELSGSVPGLQEKLLSSDKTGQEAIQKILKTASLWTSSLFNIIGSVFALIANFVMAAILSIYIVGSREKLGSQFDKLFKKVIPNKILKKIYYVLEVANSTFASFFAGQFIEAIILGSLCTLGLFIFGFPYAPMIGSVVGFTALIPLVGAYIGGIFGFFMIFTQSPLKAFLFIIFLTVLQQIEGNVIYPKVVGGSVGLPGIWVLTSIIVGGGLAGIPGVFFGVPIAATLYKILRHYVSKDQSCIVEKSET